ncbi:MAG: DUF2062 domain-containing protein [Bacteroidales bacterium]
MTEDISRITIRQRFRNNNIVVLIPTFNNERTVMQVIAQVRQYTDDILVVNDGSTDQTAELLKAAKGIDVISYSCNKGKGYALRTGMRHAFRKGYHYAITIDSDGQHFADDLLVFLDEIEANPDTLLIGSRNLTAQNMPSKNSFANRFSNFWFLVETGCRLSDTQSGFRLYPLDFVNNTRFFTNRYEFEVEVIVRASWQRIQVKNIPIKVYYPPVGERISHFRPGPDFGRISVLNTFLVLLAFLYFHPKRILTELSWHNVRQLVSKYLTNSQDSNKTIAISIGVGIFCGIIPLWGYQMIVAGLLAHSLKLNKVISVLSSNISIPPMVPFILYGSFVAGAFLLNRSIDFSLQDITWETVGYNLIQYVLGSIFLAVVCGCISALFSFSILTISRRNV